MGDFLAPGQMEPPTPRLTNADFRKLMATPRHPSSSSAQTPAHGAAAQTPGGGAMGAGKVPQTPRARDKGKADKRREKKTYYAKLKKDEDDKMAELAAKYRDRAKERRDGGPELPPGVEDAGAYRAVAPNARESHDAAERRRQMIHESKYLGGDMDHTHLVKGLDFALLQKVRSEIETREEAAAEESGDDEDKEEEEEDDKEEGPGGSKPVFGNRKARRAEAKKAKDDIVNAEKESKAKKAAVEDIDEEKKDEIACRTIMGKNIIRTIFKPDQQKVNELFIAGRMAYVMDLEEEVILYSFYTSTLTVNLLTGRDRYSDNVNQVEEGRDQQ